MAKKRVEVNVAKARATQSHEDRAANLAEEYRYVVVDLKRIAVLAAAMLVLLVVLAVILI